MSFTTSKIFSAMITDSLNNTTLSDLNSDTIEAALFNNTGTPSQSVTAANSAYAVDQWVVGNGGSDASGWPALGRPLATIVSSFTTNVYTFSAANTVSANNVSTIVGAYGCLVYDHTISTPVADQGICFNYFGGVQTVTAGTFTIAWNASGIFTLTL